MKTLKERLFVESYEPKHNNNTYNHALNNLSDAIKTLPENASKELRDALNKAFDLLEAEADKAAIKSPESQVNAVLSMFDDASKAEKDAVENLYKNYKKFCETEVETYDGKMTILDMTPYNEMTILCSLAGALICDGNDYTYYKWLGTNAYKKYGRQNPYDMNFDEEDKTNNSGLEYAIKFISKNLDDFRKLWELMARHTNEFKANNFAGMFKNIIKYTDYEYYKGNIK